jgi:hypothetical protein
MKTIQFEQTLERDEIGSLFFNWFLGRYLAEASVT